MTDIIMDFIKNSFGNFNDTIQELSLIHIQMCIRDSNRPMLEDLYKLNDNMSKFMINFLVDWELISAEEELKRIKERQRQGIEVAKSQGKHMGRPRIKMPENFGEIYSSWKAGKKTAKESMELLGLKRNVFYKMAKEYEKSYIVNDK